MNSVWFTDNRDPVACAAAAYLAGRSWRVALNDLGGKAVLGSEKTLVDLTDLHAIRAALEVFGGTLAGVVHSAPPPVHTGVENADENQWQAAFSDGALASLLVTQAAGERLTALGRGAILHLGSIHAEKPMGNGFLFSMGCAATQMLCKEAALDYGTKGVHCVYIQRGVMAHDTANKSRVSNQYCGIPHRYPKGRIPGPDSLNGLIAFLLTPEASPLNGADLMADEGYVMYYGSHAEGKHG
jgi:NAD(P)-dependent dehydrogenase (short-subunit alcohol dehydrogenase family)